MRTIRPQRQRSMAPIPAGRRELLSMELVNEAVVQGRDVLPPMGQFRYVLVL